MNRANTSFPVPIHPGAAPSHGSRPLRRLSEYVAPARVFAHDGPAVCGGRSGADDCRNNFAEAIFVITHLIT